VDSRNWGTSPTLSFWLKGKANFHLIFLDFCDQFLDIVVFCFIVERETVST